MVFFAVPKNVVFKLASKSTKIGDEGGDDSDDDDDWGAKMQAFQKAEEEREAKKAAVKQSEIAAGGAVPTSTLCVPLLMALLFISAVAERDVASLMTSAVRLRFVQLRARAAASTDH